jgi:hypothetical protein
LISAVNAYETGIVLRVRHGDAALARLWRFLLEDNDFEIERLRVSETGPR